MDDARRSKRMTRGADDHLLAVDFWWSSCESTRTTNLPLLPSRSCKSIGCSGVGLADGFCNNCHIDGKARDPRPTARQRGYDNRWQAYQKSFLLSHPVCADPYQRHPQIVRASQVVDHVIAHRGNMQLFWDRTNHQPLCSPCHNFKTATVDGGFGRQRKNA